MYYRKRFPLKQPSPKKGDSRQKAIFGPTYLSGSRLSLELSVPELQKNRPRIKALVARRNEIAHGKSMVISNLSEYHDYEHATLCLMYELAIKSMEVVEGKTYKAAAPK
jgi:hypothetical protein